MQKLALILISIMLVVAPVSAQSTTEPDVWDRFFQFVRETGAPWSVIIILVVVAGRIIKPMSDSFVENSRARTESEKAARNALETSSKAQSDGASALKDVASAMVELANVNKQTMTRMTEFEKRTEAAASRENAVTLINAHTDEAVKPVVESSNEAVADLKKLSEQMKELVTKKHFDDGMQDMQRQLDTIIQKMERKADAPPTPAPETASADGSMLSEVDAKEE